MHDPPVDPVRAPDADEHLTQGATPTPSAAVTAGLARHVDLSAVRFELGMLADPATRQALVRRYLQERADPALRKPWQVPQKAVFAIVGIAAVGQAVSLPPALATVLAVPALVYVGAEVVGAVARRRQRREGLPDVVRKRLDKVFFNGGARFLAEHDETQRAALEAELAAAALEHEATRRPPSR